MCHVPKKHHPGTKAQWKSKRSTPCTGAEVFLNKSKFYIATHSSNWRMQNKRARYILMKQQVYCRMWKNQVL